MYLSQLVLETGQVGDQTQPTQKNEKVKTMGFEPMPFLTSEMMNHLKLAP